MIALRDLLDVVTKQRLGTIDGLVCDLSLEVNNKTEAKFSSKPEEETQS